jgi:hypothetical protein
MPLGASRESICRQRVHDAAASFLLNAATAIFPSLLLNHIGFEFRIQHAKHVVH